MVVVTIRFVGDSILLSIIHAVAAAAWVFGFHWLFRDVPARRGVRTTFVGVLAAACGLFTLIICEILDILHPTYGLIYLKVHSEQHPSILVDDGFVNFTRSNCIDTSFFAMSSDVI